MILPLKVFWTIVAAGAGLAVCALMALGVYFLTAGFLGWVARAKLPKGYDRDL